MRRIGAAVSETYTAAQYPKYAELGELRYNGGNVYEFVLFVDLDTEVGDVVYPAATTGTSVSIDYTGGSSLAAKGKGFSVAAVDISEKPYGWIQRAGVHSAVRTDGGVSAGEAVIGHSVDGEVDTMADGEEELVVGFALATDGGSPTTSAVQIHGCL